MLSPHAIVVHGITAIVAPYDPDIGVIDVLSMRTVPRDWPVDVLVLDSALLATREPVAMTALADERPALVLLRPEHARQPPAGPGVLQALPLSADGPTIVNALRRAARSPENITRASARRAAGGAARLSEREAEVLRAIAAGRSNDEIASELFVSVNTVKTYVRTAYRKIGATRRAEAVIWALQHPTIVDHRGAPETPSLS